jgi:hypothetical protein
MICIADCEAQLRLGLQLDIERSWDDVAGNA